MEKQSDIHQFQPSPTSRKISTPASDEVTFTHQDIAYPYHAEHGPPIDNAVKNRELEEDYGHHHDYVWSRVRHTMRDAFCEFMGTMIMIIFGDGSVAQVTLSENLALPKSSQNKGEYQSISWG